MAYLLSPLFNDAQFDTDGDPLVGGLLYWYAAGTTTAATVYTDANGSASHTNPIILNVRGEPASPVYLDSAETYKAVLKDAGSVTQRTIDGIAGISTPSDTQSEWATFAGAPTYVSANEFSLAGNQTATFHVGRRVRASLSGNTYYGTIAASAYSSATTVRLLLDSGALDGTISAVAYGVVSFSNTSAPTLAPGRNRIINGDMRVYQRGATVTVNSASNVYTLDRWYAAGQATDGVFTVERDTTAPAGFSHSLLVTVTTADASIGVAQTYLVAQKIEGFNVADFAFGTANAKTVTVSFQVRSSVTGTFSGSLMNSAADRSYPFSFVISSANTWETKSVPIVGDTSGTWLKDSGIGLRLQIAIGSGTDYLGTAGAWTGSLKVGVTGQTNLIATNGATFRLGAVQIESGAVATPFEYREYADQLAACQRYFESVPYPAFYLPSTTATEMYIPAYLKVTKRGTPTITLPSSTDAGYNASGTLITPTTWTTVTPTVGSFSIRVGNASLGGVATGTATADAEL
jgi:hypothetical protein